MSIELVHPQALPACLIGPSIGIWIANMGVWAQKKVRTVHFEDFPTAPT